MKKILALMAGVLLSTSCSTTTKVTGLSELPTMAASTTGIALPIKLETLSSFGADGCALFVRRNDELKTFEIEFNPGKDVIVSELPAGAYGFIKIHCGHRHWDVTHKEWPRFQVFEGKIAVLGGLSIYVSESGSMTTRRSNRTKNREDTLKLLGRIPTESKASLVSAYTGKPISPAALEAPARWRHWEAEEPAGKKIKLDDEDRPTFKSCYNGEDDVNGLWLGNVEVTADYEKTNLLETKQTETWNTFTGHFVDCVKGSLKDFHPKNKAHLRYVFYI